MTQDFRLSRKNVLAFISSKYKGNAEVLLTICEATQNPDAAISLLLGTIEIPKLNKTSKIKRNACNPEFRPLEAEYAAVRFDYNAEERNIHYYDPSKFDSEDQAKKAFLSDMENWVEHNEPNKKYFYAWDGKSYYQTSSTCSVEDWNNENH